MQKVRNNRMSFLASVDRDHLAEWVGTSLAVLPCTGTRIPSNLHHVLSCLDSKSVRLASAMILELCATATRCHCFETATNKMRVKFITIQVVQFAAILSITGVTDSQALHVGRDKT